MNMYAGRATTTRRKKKNGKNKIVLLRSYCRIYAVHSPTPIFTVSCEIIQTNILFFFFFLINTPSTMMIVLRRKNNVCTLTILCMYFITRNPAKAFAHYTRPNTHTHTTHKTILFDEE